MHLLTSKNGCLTVFLPSLSPPHLLNPHQVYSRWQLQGQELRATSQTLNRTRDDLRAAREEAVDAREVRRSQGFACGGGHKRDEEEEVWSVGPWWGIMLHDLWLPFLPLFKAKEISERKCAEVEAHLSGAVARGDRFEAQLKATAAALEEMTRWGIHVWMCGCVDAWWRWGGRQRLGWGRRAANFVHQLCGHIGPYSRLVVRFVHTSPHTHIGLATRPWRRSHGSMTSQWDLRPAWRQ